MGGGSEVSMDWARGSDFPYAWPIYVILNFTAITMSLWMVGMIITAPRARQWSTNVLVVGLASTSLGLCVTCGIQCAINMHYHYFANGTWACYFMAYAHYITIIAHLHTLSLIAIRNVLAVCYEYIMSARLAWWLMLGTYLMTGVTVAVLGQFSPPYLQPSGTFCFFGWTSPVAVGFFIPSVVITTLIQAACYGKIYLHAREVLAIAIAPTAIGHKKIDKNKLQISLAKRLFVFVVVLFVCYTPALVMVIHELFIGPMFAEWDVVFAVGVLLEGVIDCILYGLQNPELQQQFVKLLIQLFIGHCQCGCLCCNNTMLYFAAKLSGDNEALTGAHILTAASSTAVATSTVRGTTRRSSLFGSSLRLSDLQLSSTRAANLHAGSPADRDRRFSTMSQSSSHLSSLLLAGAVPNSTSNLTIPIAGGHSASLSIDNRSHESNSRNSSPSPRGHSPNSAVSACGHLLAPSPGVSMLSSHGNMSPSASPNQISVLISPSAATPMADCQHNVNPTARGASSRVEGHPAEPEPEDAINVEELETELYPRSNGDNNLKYTTMQLSLATTTVTRTSLPPQNVPVLPLTGVQEPHLQQLQHRGAPCTVADVDESAFASPARGMTESRQKLRVVTDGGTLSPTKSSRGLPAGPYPMLEQLSPSPSGHSLPASPTASAGALALASHRSSGGTGSSRNLRLVQQLQLHRRSDSGSEMLQQSFANASTTPPYQPQSPINRGSGVSSSPSPTGRQANSPISRQFNAIVDPLSTPPPSASGRRKPQTLALSSIASLALGVPAAPSPTNGTSARGLAIRTTMASSKVKPGAASDTVIINSNGKGTNTATFLRSTIG